MKISNAKFFFFTLVATVALTLNWGCGIGLLPPPTPLPFVIGQTDLNSSFQNERTFLSPGDMIRTGNKLIVTDFYGGRVLIWNSVPTSQSDVPDLVLGKTSVKAGNNASEFSVNAKSIYSAGGAATDGTRLVVNDSENHRALIWHTFPTTSYQAADVVIGQPDFTSNADNYGGLSASSLSNPNTVGINGGKLFIGDYANKRILVWNTIPTTNNAAANYVIGQDDFISTANACAANRFNQTLQGRFTFDGGKFYVADTNRVLVFNTVPNASGASADFVIGKPNLTDCTNGTTNSLTSWTYGVTVANSKLALADWGNSRVLIFNSIPVADNAAADVVLGQTNFTSNASPGCDGLYNAKATIGPVNVLYDGSKFFVADWLFGFSISIWNTIPTANCTASNSILGQPDATTRKRAFVGSENNLFSANDFYLNDRLIVPDLFGNRTLIWTTPPTSNTPADQALGVAHPNQSDPTPNANTMKQVGATDSDGTRLAVADAGWHRVMLWNTVPSAAGTNADVILGQPTTVAITANNGGISGATLSAPSGVLMAEGKLIVADSGNHRVLIWNSIPGITGTAADVVIGQPGFSSATANQGGAASGKTLNNPVGLAYANKKLFISDQNNHRILVFDNIPGSSNPTANSVIGQSDFQTVSANAGGTVSAASLNAPHGLSADAFQLWVADSRNHRVMNYTLTSIKTGINAKGVYGQTSFSSVALPSVPTEQNFLLPKKAVRKGQYLYILDAFSRITAIAFTF